MPPSSSLPPYITSGASSRAHHAFLVKINGAASRQEQDEIIRDQVRRAKEVLVIGQSTSKILETLIVLLHCRVVGHDTPKDTNYDFALLPALGLAESGKTVYERRIGYLYLCECLPRDHELQLMLINTIRKDLSSQHAQNVLLALHAIIHLPSSDLEPAVTQLLTSKVLLRHPQPAVRQRTLQALHSLHLSSDSLSLSRTIGPKSFPLAIPRLVKLLEQEEDASVQSTLLKLLTDLLKSEIHVVRDETERAFLVEQVIGCTSQTEVEALDLTATRCLGAVLLSGKRVKSLQGQALDAVLEWIGETLDGLQQSRGWDKGLLLEICQLVANVRQLQDSSATSSRVLCRLSTILRGPAITAASSDTHHMPRPDDHVLVLRCLSSLPLSMWSESLADDAMAALMQGLDSPDDTIRRCTLGLLNRLSPDLLHLNLRNHLEAVRTSTDLSLPLGIGTEVGDAEKLKRARNETALRAFEVAEAICEAQILDNVGLAAREYVGAVQEVLGYLGDAQGGQGREVWEEGVKRVLEFVSAREDRFRSKVATALIRDRSDASGPAPPPSLLSVSMTWAVIQATLIPDAGNLSKQDTEAALTVLLGRIQQASSSVQELVMIAALILCAKLPRTERDESIKVLEASVQSLEEPSRYIAKRIRQVLQVLHEPTQIDTLLLKAKSNSLPDVLDSLINLTSRSRSRHRPDQPTTASDPRYNALGNTTASDSPSISASVSTRSLGSPTLSLRYAPYDAPQSPNRADRDHGNGDISTRRRSPRAGSATRGGQRPTRGEREDYTRAGDYALFDADLDAQAEAEREREAEADADVESVDMGIGSPLSFQDNDPTLVSLSLDDAASNRSGSRPPDPFLREMS